MKKLLICLSLPLFLAACSPEEKVEEPPVENQAMTVKVTPEALHNQHWELTHIDGVEFINEKAPVPTLGIAESMQAGGSAGCNNFFGQAELNEDNTQLKITGMGLTRKMCLNDLMETEQIVSSTLSIWSDISLTKETLTLKNEEHVLTFALALKDKM